MIIIQMENANPIQFDVQLTEADYRRLNLMHQRKMMRISFVAYVLLFFLVIMWANDFQWDPVFAAVGLIGGLAVGLLFIGLNYGAIVIQTKRYFTSDKLMQHKYTYRFSDDGIKIDSSSGSNEIKWDDVFKVVSDKKIVALYVGKGRAFIIPKDAVRTSGADGWRRFADIIKRNVPADKVGLNE